jgi:copper chaperone CopZ
MERLTIRIPDLTCASCVSQIEQLLRQQEGVIWAIVNFAAGEATLMVDPSEFDLVQVAQSMRELHYQILLEDAPILNLRPANIRKKPLAKMQRWVRTFIL